MLPSHWKSKADVYPIVVDLNSVNLPKSSSKPVREGSCCSIQNYLLFMPKLPLYQDYCFGNTIKNSSKFRELWTNTALLKISALSGCFFPAQRLSSFCILKSNMETQIYDNCNLNCRKESLITNFMSSNLHWWSLTNNKSL